MIQDFKNSLWLFFKTGTARPLRGLGLPRVLEKLKYNRYIAWGFDFKHTGVLQPVLRAIRYLKAQNIYFSARKNLGTIGVPFLPKKYKSRFYYKIYQNLTDSTHKWNSKLFNAVSNVSMTKNWSQKVEPPRICLEINPLSKINIKWKCQF